MQSLPSVPRHVLLFSGHMIDAPGRKSPRFPAAMEPLARDAIEQKLDQIGAGADCIAVCSGACGGDLLFAEAALARGVALQVYLPFDVATFAANSVDFAGGDWHARFDAACEAAELHLMPEERPPLAEGQDPYEQVNLWMLEAASAHGAEKVVFIALWNGQGGDGPGGTQHMMEAVRSHRGQTHWLDTTRLWR
jgi:hypothetical protein